MFTPLVKQSIHRAQFQVNQRVQCFPICASEKIWEHHEVSDTLRWRQISILRKCELRPCRQAVPACYWHPRALIKIFKKVKFCPGIASTRPTGFFSRQLLLVLQHHLVLVKRPLNIRLKDLSAEVFSPEDNAMLFFNTCSAMYYHVHPVPPFLQQQRQQHRQQQHLCQLNFIF